MRGRLDSYVTRIVLGSWFAALLFMVLLFTLIDILLGLGSYLDEAQQRGAGFGELLVDLGRYYALFQPVVFVTIAPFVTVIAGMFAVARLMSSNELVPMLFTGRSVLRVLRPLLATAVVATLAMMACWQWVVPVIAEPLQQAHAVLAGGAGEAAIPDVAVELPGGRGQRTLFIAEYHHAETRMVAPILVERGSAREDVVTVEGASAEWDAQLGDWRVESGRRHTPTSTRVVETLGVPEVTPDLLWRIGKEGRDTVALSYSDLQELQALRPQRRDFQLAFHSHLTFPLANLVLLLLALPLALHYERRRRIERVVFAVVLCGAYFITDLTCQNLGVTMLHPVLAAWLPTILFGSFGIAFFGGIRT